MLTHGSLFAGIGGFDLGFEEQRQEQTEAVDKLSAAEEHKAQVWRKRFCVFLCLLAFATLAGWLAGKL